MKIRFRYFSLCLSGLRILWKRLEESTTYSLMLLVLMAALPLVYCQSERIPVESPRSLAHPFHRGRVLSTKSS